MPDFTDTFSGVKPPSPKKLTTFEPFNLTTLQRGFEKTEKFQQVVETELKRKDSIACFKATPVRMNKNGSLPDKVKSDKQATKAVGITLQSNERSVKREMFEQMKKEKARQLDEELQQQEQERIRREVEEVKKIRANSNFKATPIKKFSNKLPEVARKDLTVPQSPVFQTLERAALRDVNMNIE